MSKEKDHTFAWQFFGCGFAVAFIVMVVLWYNASVSATQLRVQADYLVQLKDNADSEAGYWKMERDSLLGALDDVKNELRILRDSVNFNAVTHISNAGTVIIGN